MPVCETESGFSPDTEYVDTFIMDFPDARNVRNKFLFIIHLVYVYGILL